MKHERGFTLIEVIVVLAIIGMVGASIALATGRDDTNEKALARLRQVLELAAERAEVSGTAIAVDFVPGGYRFSRFNVRGEWTPLRGDPLFGDQRLGQELLWGKLELDGIVAPPRLVFTSLMPAFVLHVGTPVGDVRLVGGPSGSVALLRSEAYEP